MMRNSKGGGKKMPRVKEFKYLGSTVQKSGSCERKVKKRVQAGRNGWRKVSGVICDKRLPARVKGKVYCSMVRPAMVYGLKTVAVTEKQVEEIEVAEIKILRFCYESDKKRQYEGGQAEMVSKCHEERPRVCRKKDDGNGVTGKEEKRETEEKIFRCSEGRYEKSWCEGDGR